MQMYFKKFLGKIPYTFVVEGKNLFECVMESQKQSWSSVKECGICKSEKLVLNARLAQNKYEYTEIKCLDCKASVTFGSKKEDRDTFYLRRNDDHSLKWEKYEQKEKQEDWGA